LIGTLFLAQKAKVELLSIQDPAQLVPVPVPLPLLQLQAQKVADEVAGIDNVWDALKFIDEVGRSVEERRQELAKLGNPSEGHH